MSRLRWEWWIAAALLVAFMWRFSALTLYFLAAVALSFVGKPIVNGVARRRVGGRQLGTNLGAVVALTSIFLFSTGVLMLFAPLVQEQVQALGQLDTAQLTQRWNEALAIVDAWTAGIDLSGAGMQNSAYLAEQAMDLVQLHNASALFSGQTLVLDRKRICHRIFRVVHGVLPHARTDAFPGPHADLDP